MCDSVYARLCQSYVCMLMRCVYMYESVYLRLWLLYPFVLVCIVCVFVCVCACVCMCMCARMFVCFSVYARLCMHVCLYVYGCVRAFVCVHEALSACAHLCPHGKPVQVRERLYSGVGERAHSC
mgnify:CR=1 FL=1